VNDFKNNKNRKSQRLTTYDYSQDGLYFITICTKDRQELFGEIKNKTMILNRLGEIIKNSLINISNYFENIFLDTYVIMPNHVHIIIEINHVDVATVNNIVMTVGNRVGAVGSIVGAVGNIVGAVHEPPLRDRRQMLIPRILGKFKMLSAKEINISLNNSGNSIWQRNYYDHIIRNDESLNKIREYIIKNPEMWQRDRNLPENVFV